MERHGFIHDMLDVKLLILHVMTRVMYPVDVQKIYELCYQDECLSYFDVMQAVPQMVASGHLAQKEDGTYVITQRGSETALIMDDSIARPVRRRADVEIERFNRDTLKTAVEQIGENQFDVALELSDERGSLASFRLTAPSKRQARVLERSFAANAELVYQTVMDLLLAQAEKAPEDSVQ